MRSNMHAKASALLKSSLFQGCPLKTVSGGQLQGEELGAVQRLFPGEARQYTMCFKNGFPGCRTESKTIRDRNGQT